MALAVAGLAAATPACWSVRHREEPFRKVRPPVAFEILLDSPDVPVLDVRPAADFHGPLGHLEGARSMPLDQLPRRYLEILELRDETFLVYCHASECEPAAMDFLLQHGFEDVMLIDGGIAAWVGDGFRTVGAGDPPEHDDGARKSPGPAFRPR
jgi:rhodanese-related sulfurtransferase